MRRYYAYYKRIMHHKYLYFKYGKKFGVSFLERLTHNFDMLKPSFATKVVGVLYLSDGSVRRYNDIDQESDYLQLIEDYKKNHPYYVEYWLANKLEIIPDKYLRQFITDRYISCEMNLESFLVSNRDLFFLKDSSTEPTYSNQVDSMLNEFILDQE